LEDQRDTRDAARRDAASAVDEEAQIETETEAEKKKNS
jgi:hypothetical protein